MNFFKTLFDFLFHKNHVLSKKVYTFGCVIVTTCIVSVFMFGAYGYLVSVYNSPLAQQEQESVSKELELETLEMMSENEDEIALLFDQSAYLNSIFQFESFLSIQDIDSPSQGKVLAIMDGKGNHDILSTQSITGDRENLEKRLRNGMTEEGYTPKIKYRDPVQLTDTDYQVLLRIVEAEVGAEDLYNRTIIANAIINRMYSDVYPDTIEAVVFQKSGSVYQFSPILDGRYYDVKVSPETELAVKIAMAGIDNSAGALAFVNRQITSEKNMEWFDTYLEPVTQYGVVEFFKLK